MSPPPASPSPGTRSAACWSRSRRRGRSSGGRWAADATRGRPAWTASSSGLPAREAGDRNFPLFYAAKQAALAGQLDGAAVERFVDAARRSGLAGGEREARRTIASAQREAATLRPFSFAPQRQMEAG